MGTELAWQAVSRNCIDKREWFLSRLMMRSILSTTVPQAGNIRAEVGSEFVPKLRFQSKSIGRGTTVSRVCVVRASMASGLWLLDFILIVKLHCSQPDPRLHPRPSPPPSSPKPKSYAGWECNVGTKAQCPIETG